MWDSNYLIFCRESSGRRHVLSAGVPFYKWYSVLIAIGANSQCEHILKPAIN